MKLHAQSRKLLRYALTAGSVFAISLFVGQRAVNAQTMTLDFTINSDINSPTATATIAPNSTYTIDAWVVLEPGANSPGGATASDLGYTSAYFGARSTTTSTDAIIGGSTTSSSGVSTGVGITAFTIGSSIFTPTAVSPGDWNGDGVNDISSLSTKGTTLNVSTTSTTNVFGGGANGEADGSGWAFELGTFTVTTGSSVGAAGTNTTFTPSIPTFGGARDDWTFNGGTSQVFNTSTPTSYPLLAGSAVTFSVAGGGGGNTTVLALSPTTLTYNLLQNAASPSAAQNLSLQETSSTGSATYTGVTAGNFNVNNGASGTVSSGATNTLATTYTGSTAADGSFIGSYTASNTSGSTATQGNLVSNFTAVVGNATDDKLATGTFTGTVLSATVANGGLYNGLASSSNSGTKASNGTLPGIEGSTATILLGTNNQGSAMTPSMTWRSRMAVETPANDSVGGTGFVNGTPMSPPLPNGRHPIGLISDVVDLFGMSSTSAGPTGSTTGTVAPVQVDPFAFEMNFNPATMIAEGSSGNAMASHGNLYLASLVPVSGVANWENTIVANFEPAGSSATAKFGQVGGTQSNIDIGISAAAAMNAGNALDASSGTFDYPILEPFATWASANGVTAANIGNYVGVWGVDTSSSAGGDEAWAVVDHNSEFAVVPEPSTLILAGFGLFGACLVVSKRRKNIAAA